jgi:hypothetical protein
MALSRTSSLYSSARRVIHKNRNRMSRLTHVERRILLKVDLNFKNNHTFSNGVTIKLERRYENFDRKYTEPVSGEVISGEGIPKGSLILFHHNGCREENEILNHGQLSGEEIASDIKYFSVVEEECYAWKDADGEWQPMPTFDFALRVFEKYEGIIQGIEPTLIKDTLYMRTGEYAGKVVRTLKATDYEIVFREPNTGQESRLIRCRPNGDYKWISGDEKMGREPEVVAIDNNLTKKVNNKQVLIGLNKSDAKPINEYICQ